jgi:hypothetical protein
MVDVHVDSLASLLREIQTKQPPAPVPVVAPKQEEPDASTVTHQEPSLGSVTIKNVFRHPGAHPLVLDLLLINKYQEEWLGWEYETIERRVPEDFGVDRVSDLNLSKLQAVKTLHLVDSFWQRWEVFVWCTMPLNAVFPDFQVMQVPTVLQCMVSVDMAKRVRDDVAWEEEVKQYLSVVHSHDGILLPQAPLDFVEVDVKGFPIDLGSVVERWGSVRSSRTAPTGDTVEDEQLRRMLELYEELEGHRGRLRQQLEILRHV